MNGVVFEPDLPLQAADPDRADVACFVGLVRLRASTAEGKLAMPLSRAKQQWLRESGWLEGRQERDCSALADVPVPIEGFAGFTALFDDGSSPSATGTDYLAAAVRGFFSQGGKKAYVVRMGDPVGIESTAEDRQELVKTLLGLNRKRAPDDASPALPRPDDPSSWSGLAHVWGLSDVSFLLLPDLPVLHASQLRVADGKETDPSSGPEQFVVCTPDEVPLIPKRAFPLPAPRLALADYQRWGDTLLAIVNTLSSGRLREVQFIAALPLPAVGLSTAQAATGSETESKDLALVMATIFPAPGGARDPRSPASAFLQLGFPWLRTSQSGSLLEGLEPPDGALAGLVARNALLRGTFTSASKTVPIDIVDLAPDLPSWQTQPPASRDLGPDAKTIPLITRVSLFGLTPAGVRLLSDVTTYAGEAYRPARINRLVSVLSRAARRFGDDHVFDHNGPRLWAQFEHTMRQILTRLVALGALESTPGTPAFEVRCNRSTMTEADLDNGRLIAYVAFQAAAVIERIEVNLTVATAGATVAEIELPRLGVP